MRIAYITENYEYVQKHLYIAFSKEDNPLFLCYQLNNRKRGNIDSEVEGVLNFRVRSNFRGPLFLIGRLRRVAKYYCKVLKKIKPDILHGNMSFSDGFICRYIYKRLKIPYVLSFRDTDLNLWFYWRLPWLKSMGMNNFLYAKSIIFLSKSYKEKLLNKLPTSIHQCVAKKSYIIPNGVDDFYIKNASSAPRITNELVIIYVGRVIKRKNIELTIQAIELLKKSGMDIKYLVVGPVESDFYLKMLNEKEYIEYHPKSPKEVIINYYRRANIFVMPSHTESFGLTYLEAMTQGLPVIYTKGQGFDGFFDEGVVGYHVSDTDANDLASKIKAIIANYNLISNNCTQLSTMYSWDYVIKMFKEVYNESN